ncbi:globin family protein [Paraglaciecola marina]|uniref:globin family protein n=1 Tax=Paraglaciecola marina TaxID=2500157 RepID=UPI00105F597A|nr:globin family protein [Paraglaciecola marina]
MNKYQITLVQESFSKIVPISSLAAKLFYNKLFELNPKLKPLFKQDITEQGTKLMKMLGIAVNNLNNLEMLIPMVYTLGERHIGYGVKEEHYDTVGEALIWTLEQALGKAFTPELKDAWLIAYTTLATVMIEAANKKLN